MVVPVQKCSNNGRPGYKWGNSGTCYTYNANDTTSQAAARKKASMQGAAARVSMYRKIIQSFLPGGQNGRR